MRTDVSKQAVVLVPLLLAATVVAGAQHTAPSGQNTRAQQSSTGGTATLPSAAGTPLGQYVTAANFRISARPDSGMTVLPQEQGNRYRVTMQGDMQFRTGGYRVSTDAQVLERSPADIRYTIDISSPRGPATQVVTPRTVQEQVTVGPGTYDATVIVTVDNQVVYREQRRLQLGRSYTANSRPQQPQTGRMQEQDRALEENTQRMQRTNSGQQQSQTQRQPRQEAEQALQEQGQRQRQQTRQMGSIQQRIQQLEQRIVRLEQTLQLRGQQGSRGTGVTPGQSPTAAGQQSDQVTRDGTAQPRNGQPSPQSTGSRSQRSNGSGDAAVVSAPGGQQNMSVDIVTDRSAGTEAEMAMQESGQSGGPVRILISIFS